MTKTAKKVPEVKITEEEAMNFLLEQQNKEKQEIMTDLDKILTEKYKGKYSLGIRWEFVLMPTGK
jgi:hypothetical protein